MQQGIEGMLLAARSVLSVDAIRIALQGHPVLKAELERVRSGLPMAGLDIARYRLDEPSLSKRNDMAAWRSALDNAHSQLEHQYNRSSPTMTPCTAAAGNEGTKKIERVLLILAKSCLASAGTSSLPAFCALLQAAQSGAAIAVRPSSMAGSHQAP